MVLWRGHGRFATLFKFLAGRFLANPDSVLDVERQHAVWQWVLQRRRSMKLKSLNAWLKLSAYLRGHGPLPPTEELTGYVTDFRAGLRAAVAGANAADGIAPGLRADSMFWRRLNLTAAEAALLRVDARDAAEPARRTFEVAWANYLRWTFARGKFYSFPSLRPSQYLYVAENKSLAGREARAEDDAWGRSLSVAWFESQEVTDEGTVVRRLDRISAEDLTTMLSTLAEILHAAGVPYPALGAAATARTVEIAMENVYADTPRYVHPAEHLWQEDDAWTCLLREPDPAETKYLAETPLEDLTNMTLARPLEIMKGVDRRAAWTRTKADLLAALAAP